MSADWLSVEQVADRLGLHVRTVRGYIRGGRLKAVRIGKQYRIAPADLAAFTGRPAPAAGAAVEVSTVVDVDGIDAVTADRLSTLLVAGAQTARTTLRVRAIHDDTRSHLKVVILGDAGVTADVLRTLDDFLASAAPAHG